MSEPLKKIAVLVSVGRHPVSGVARYSRNDAAALDIGRTLSQRYGARLDTLHVGDPSNPALKDYLALGAERVEVLTSQQDSGDDAVAALKARLQGYDLVLTGTCAEGAFDSGMLPYQLADALGYPLVGSAVDVNIDTNVDANAHEKRVTVRQFLPKGVRRRVAVTVPAVIAVHPLAATTPRYAYARLQAGAITVSAQPVTPAANAESAQWRVAALQRKPVRLAAAEKRSGHARMTAATSTESRGGSVVIEGTSVEKAQVILDYLREHQLIDY